MTGGIGMGQRLRTAPVALREPAGKPNRTSIVPQPQLSTCGWLPPDLNPELPTSFDRPTWSAAAHAQTRFHAIATPRVSSRPIASHSDAYRWPPPAVPHQAKRRKRPVFSLFFAVLAVAPQWRRKQEPKTRGFEPSEEAGTCSAKAAKTA